MNLLPSEQFVVETSATPTMVHDTLAGSIEPRRWLPATADHKVFHGTLTPYGFEVRRVIDYQNSFLPVITGLIRATSAGSSVGIRMTLSPLVVLFGALWLGFVALTCVGVLIATVSGVVGLHPAQLVPFALLVLAPTFVWGNFRHEVKVTKPILIALLARLDRNDATLRPDPP